MSIIVDPNQIKVQSSTSKQKGFGTEDFSATMSAIAPGAAEAMYQFGGGYDSAAVTHAAVTGVAGASQSLTYANPYGLPGGLVGATGYAPPLVGGATSALTLPGVGSPSQSFIEGNALIQAMTDSNMKMLVLQSNVQEVGKYYTTLSNALQAKFQSEMNAVRNIRAA